MQTQPNNRSSLTFLLRSAMLQRDLAIGGVSICLSVTCQYWLKTNENGTRQHHTYNGRL